MPEQDPKTFPRPHDAATAPPAAGPPAADPQAEVTSHHAHTPRPPEGDQGRAGGWRNVKLAGPWTLVALTVGVIAVAGLLFLFLYPSYYNGRILPGVRVAGVPVGGLSVDAAAELLRKRLAAFHGPVTLRDPKDKRTWQFPANELGIGDPSALAETAYAVGRGGEGDPLDTDTNPIGRTMAQLRLARDGYELPGEWMFGAGIAVHTLDALAPKVDVAPKNADARMEDGKLVAIPAQVGHQLDVTGTLQLLALALDDPAQIRSATGGLAVDIAVRLTGARIPELDSIEQAIQRVNSSPITMTIRSGHSFVISATQLAAWFTVQRLKNESGEEVPTIVVDRDAISKWLLGVAPVVNRRPQNARFKYDNTVVSVLDPGHGGETLDLTGSVETVVDTAYSEQRNGVLAINTVPAGVTEEDLADVGPVEELARSSTRFAGSPDGRVNDLTQAVQALNGAVVRPGGEFSFNQALGPVSAEAGYDLAYANPTPPETAPVTATIASAPDLGNAIAQVATTVFRVAFWTGLPITERHAPRARVGWYEPPVGLDATVDGGALDLKFLNDSTDFMIVQMEMDAKRGAVTAVLYGLARNVRVDALGPTVTNLRPALGQSTQRDPTLPAGARLQVEWAREGGDVHVERLVRQGDALLSRDVFASSYVPAGDVFRVGPR